jgi:hypothetical protein
MFTNLAALLVRLSATIVDGLISYAIKIWEAQRKFFSAVTVIAIVGVAWFLWACTYIGEFVSSVLDILTNVALIFGGLDPVTVTNNQYFSLINTFFPLAELFAAMILYAGFYAATFVLRLVVQVYRLVPVKST